MSHIPTPSVEDAPVLSRPLLALVEERFGVIPNFYRVVSNSPAALQAVLHFQSALHGGALDSLIAERIALTVAEENGCDYCLSAQAYRTGKAGLLDDVEITANRNGASTTSLSMRRCASPGSWRARGGMSLSSISTTSSVPGTRTRRLSKSSRTSPSTSSPISSTRR